MAENQTTSVMGSRKIADKMNEIFENQGRLNSSGKQFKISKSTICKYLNKKLKKNKWGLGDGDCLLLCTNL